MKLLIQKIKGVALAMTFRKNLSAFLCKALSNSTYSYQCLGDDLSDENIAYSIEWKLPSITKENIPKTEEGTQLKNTYMKCLEVVVN